MKKFKDEIIQTLKLSNWFKERKNKDRGIVRLLMRRYPGLREVVEKRIITEDNLIEMMRDYASLDRAWRQALEQNPELRGTEYEEKSKLEKQKQEELGYNV